MYHQQDGFILHDNFYLRLSPYISNLYNPEQNLSLASQTICDHMFSDPKLDYNFQFFLVRYLSDVSSSHMWQFSTYFEDSKVLESTANWFLSESNQLQPGYYFLPNKNPNLKYYLEKCFENSIE